ncbi:MAG: hypothetical protein ABH824_03000 [Nanoarchaeota archaeon]|nr:hypothetical protein [Nanoarchaeota archaeon]MBU1631741.1 hypothetical protein [Nanoarchaeota archaeon]MBU1875545.1 hypothetical protein [Nanoarchaeota archaeon]
MVKSKKVLEKDISNKVVVVMLLVVILVSAVSLAIYMNALTKAEPQVNSAAQGKISLTIVEPPAEPAEPVEESGKLSLKVVEPQK